MLRLPSMQVADGRHSPRLVVTNVGKEGIQDLGEHSLSENLNLAVSGDPGSPLCTNPALRTILEENTGGSAGSAPPPPVPPAKGGSSG